MEFLKNESLFPAKLWHLVNSGFDGITWNHQGDGITVEQSIMENDFLYLDDHDPHRVSNFRRQLKLYGFKKSRDFKRSNPKHRHYFHHMFQRSQPELLSLLRRCDETIRLRVKVDHRGSSPGMSEGRQNLSKSDTDEDSNAPMDQGESLASPLPAERADEDSGSSSGAESSEPNRPPPPSDQKMQKNKRSLARKLFPDKLWRLVNDSGVDAIFWNTAGDGIMIRKGLIQKKFLSFHGFKASAFSSFTQQLRLYGFEKVQRNPRHDVAEYSHPNFKRGRPHLLPLVRRQSQQPGQQPAPRVVVDRQEPTEDWWNLSDSDTKGDREAPPLWDQKIPGNKPSVARKLFPEKLWGLVNDRAVDAIFWNTPGDGIMIRKSLIQKEFLSSHGFKASTFTSFTQQLRLYGFESSQRLTKDVGQYSHPNFKRGQPHLLALVRRNGQQPGQQPPPRVEVDRRELTEGWRNLSDSDTDDDRDAPPHQEKLHQQPTPVWTQIHKTRDSMEYSSSDGSISPFEPINPVFSLPPKVFVNRRRWPAKPDLNLWDNTFGMMN